MAKALKAKSLETAQFSDLVSDLQKDHSELSGLLASFQSAVESSDRRDAKGILNRIEDVTNGHFRFEGSYLYPRMRRLMFEMIEKLCNEQETIRGFIKESNDILNKGRLNKNNASSLLAILPVLSKYLKDCNDLILLADKFEKEEKSDLSQKFKECCERRGSR